MTCDMEEDDEEEEKVEEEEEEERRTSIRIRLINWLLLDGL